MLIYRVEQGWRGTTEPAAKWVAVVAVTASEVKVLHAKPVGELTGLLVRQCSALSEETERLWAEVMRLVGENERLRAKVGKLEGLLEEAMITGLDRRRRHGWSRLRAITPVGKHGNGENQDDRPGEHEI